MVIWEYIKKAIAALNAKVNPPPKEEPKPTSFFIDLNPIGFGEPMIIKNDVTLEVGCLSCGRTWKEPAKGKGYIPNYVLMYDSCSHCGISRDTNG